MPENRIDEKVIDRIRKLFRLASGTSEKEAAAAMEKAHEILARYNLDIDDVSEEGENHDEKQKYIKDSNSVEKWYEPWTRNVWNACAELYFCKYFWRNDYWISNSGREYVGINHIVIGRKDNVRICKEMASWLVDVIRALAKSEASKQSNVGNLRRRYKHAFEIGCSRRLVSRIYERRDVSTNNPKLPVLYKSESDRIKEFMESIQQKIREASKTGWQQSISDEDGFKDGVQMAEGIPLNPQLPEKRGEPLGSIS